MGGRLSRAVLAALLLLLPLLLFWYAYREGARLSWEDLQRDEEQQMLFWLDRTRTFALPEFQLTELLMRVARTVPEQDFPEGEKTLQERYDRLLRPILPRHDFFLVRELPGNFSPVFQVDGGLGFGRVLREYCATIRVPLKAPNEEKDIHDVRLAKACREELGLNLLPSVQSRQNGVVQFLRAASGNRLLFWAYVSRKGMEPPAWTFYVFLDLEKLDRDLPLSLQVKGWGNPDYGLLYLDPMGGGSFESRFFRKHGEILDDLRRHPPRGGANPFSEMRGGYLVTVGRSLQGRAVRPILVKSLEKPWQAASQQGWVVFFALAGILWVWLWHLVEHFLFGRQTRLAVRTVLVGTFTLAALLPLGSASYTVERFLVEEFRREGLTLKRGLTNDLECLDEGNRVFLASFTAYLREYANTPGVAREVAAAWARNPDTTGFLPWLVRRITKAMPISTEVGLVIGPDGRSWAGKAPVDSEEVETLKPNPFFKVLSNLYYKHLTTMNPRLSKGRKDPSGGGRGDPKRPPRGPPSVGMEKEALEEEIIRETMGDLIGPGAFFTLAYQPMTTSAFRTLNGINSQSGTLVRVAGRAQFLIKWFWENRFLDSIFFESTLGRRRETVDLANFTAGFLGFRDLELGFPLSRRDLLVRDPLLLNQLRMAFRYSHSVRVKEIKVPGKPLLEIVPGDHFVGMLAGRRSTLPLEARGSERRWWTYLALAVAFLLSLVGGRAVAEYFSRPLQELVRKVEDIRAGRFEARLDEGRGDEFGSLARSFNLLARGLQEGKILERYVSAAVKDVVRGDDSESVRKTSEACGATILFSGLHGFSEFAHGREGPAAVAPLRDHLDACHAAVKELGGEIDKMIGDKVMMVFRHREFADDRAAVGAGIAVVKAIRARLAAAGCPLTPVMGLNTGQVISGILGAAQVRLDHTVIGDPVNLAARLCALAHSTSGTRVVISGETLRYLDPGAIRVTRLPIRNVKGKTQQIEAFLLGEDSITARPGDRGGRS